MNQVTAARFQEVGVALTTDFYGAGTHTWPYWERELHRSLPMLLNSLAADDEANAARPAA
jgi:S-formylglutathione hydrolase FrmB